VYLPCPKTDLQISPSGYLYLLTLQGIEEKAALTKAFLVRKLQEHEELTAEIEMLRREVSNEAQNLL